MCIRDSYNVYCVENGKVVSAKQCVMHTGNVWSESETSASNMTQWQLYVGGKPSHLSSSSELSVPSVMSGFVGCLSHLYVDELTLQLAKAAAHLTGLVDCCR